MEIMTEVRPFRSDIKTDVTVQKDSNEDLLCDLVNKVDLQDRVCESVEEKIKVESPKMQDLDKTEEADNLDHGEVKQASGDDKFDDIVTKLADVFDVATRIDSETQDPSCKKNVFSDDKTKTREIISCLSREDEKNESGEANLICRGPTFGIPVGPPAQCDGFLNADDVMDYLKDLPTSDVVYPSSKYRRPNDSDFKTTHNIDNWQPVQSVSDWRPVQPASDWQPVQPTSDWQPVAVLNGTPWLSVSLQKGPPITCESVNSMPYGVWSNPEPWMSFNDAGSFRGNFNAFTGGNQYQLPPLQTYLLGPGSKSDISTSCGVQYKATPVTNTVPFIQTLPSTNFQSPASFQCYQESRPTILTMPYIPASVKVSDLAPAEPTNAFLVGRDTGVTASSLSAAAVAPNVPNQLHGIEAWLDSSNSLIDSDDVDWLFKQIGEQIGKGDTIEDNDIDISEMLILGDDVSDAPLLNVIPGDFGIPSLAFPFTDSLTKHPADFSGSVGTNLLPSHGPYSPYNLMSPYSDQTSIQSPSSSLKSHGSPDSGFADGSSQDVLEQDFHGGATQENMAIPVTVVEKWNEPDSVHDDRHARVSRTTNGASPRANKHKIGETACLPKSGDISRGDVQILRSSTSSNGGILQASGLSPVSKSKQIVGAEGIETIASASSQLPKPKKTQAKPKQDCRPRPILPSPVVRTGGNASSQFLKESSGRGSQSSGRLPTAPPPVVLSVVSDAQPTRSPVASLSSPGGQSTSAGESVRHSQDDIKIYRQVAGLPRAKLLQADHEGFTILLIAISQGHQKLVEALLDRIGRECLMAEALNAVNHQHQTPLSLAVILNHSSIVRQLINRGADVNVILRKTLGSVEGGVAHYRSLHVAASNGVTSEATLREIIAANDVDLDAVNYQGLTALHTAVNAHGTRSETNGEIINSMSSIYLLAQRGANLNIADNLVGKTALHYIVEKRDLSLVSWYLELVSHLHQAAAGGAAPGSKSSAAPQEVVNARTRAGYTALQIAAELEMNPVAREEIVRLLVVNGALEERRRSGGPRTVNGLDR